jgi:hypothetical protein
MWHNMTLALPLRRLLSGIASPQNASHRTHHIVAFVIHAIASFVKDIPPRYRLSANIKVARKNAPTTIPKNGAPSVRHATSIKMKSASITPPKNGTKFMKQKLSSYVNLHHLNDGNHVDCITTNNLAMRSCGRLRRQQ